jgi:hypothetical protein
MAGVGGPVKENGIRDANDAYIWLVLESEIYFKIEAKAVPRLITAKFIS